MNARENAGSAVSTAKREYQRQCFPQSLAQVGANWTQDSHDSSRHDVLTPGFGKRHDKIENVVLVKGFPVPK